MKRRQCNQMRQLSAAIDAGDALPPVLRDHLTRCADCARFYESLEAQRPHFVSVVETPRLRAEGVLLARALNEFDRQNNAPLVPFWRTGRGRFAALGLAGAGVAATMLYLLRPTTPTDAPNVPSGTGVAAVPSPPPAPIPAASNAPVASSDSRPVASETRRNTFVPLGNPSERPTIGPVAVSPPRRVVPAPMPTLPPAPKVAETDDLAQINVSPEVSAQQWAAIPPDDWTELEQRVRQTTRQPDDFVSIPFPRLASAGGGEATAIAEYRRQAAIVDTRLQRAVTLAVQSEPFADFCARLTRTTGIEFNTDASVADDKITLFCKDRTLRDVMRQISQHFGFTWRREGERGAYRYTLTQEVKSLLLEEELRNRDRAAALNAIDAKMYPYRFLLKYDAQQATQTAIDEWRRQREAQRAGKKLGPPDEFRLKMLDTYRERWGPFNLYFDLTREQFASLLRGERLKFRRNPSEGEIPISAATERGIRYAQRGVRVTGDANSGFSGVYTGSVSLETLIRHAENPDAKTPDVTGGVPAKALYLVDVPNASGTAELYIEQTELSRMELMGGQGFDLPRNKGVNGQGFMTATTIAVGEGLNQPINYKRNRGVIPASVSDALKAIPVRDFALAPTLTFPPDPLDWYPASRKRTAGGVRQSDVLKRLHELTGRDVIGDDYTRVFETDDLPEIKSGSAYDALCQMCDKIGVRWNVSAGESNRHWLTFRRVAFFNDRLTDVPQRDLSHWAAKRRERGYLTVDEIAEIARLSDTILNSAALAKAANAIYGLREWRYAAASGSREWLRLYADLNEAQRAALWSDSGLRLSTLTPPQQNRLLECIGRDGNEVSKAERDGIFSTGILHGHYITLPDADHPNAVDATRPDAVDATRPDAVDGDMPPPPRDAPNIVFNYRAEPFPGGFVRSNHWLTSFTQ